MYTICHGQLISKLLIVDFIQCHKKFIAQSISKLSGYTFFYEKMTIFMNCLIFFSWERMKFILKQHLFTFRSVFEV